MMTLSGTLPTHGDQIVHMCGLRWVDTSKRDSPDCKILVVSRTAAETMAKCL